MSARAKAIACISASAFGFALMAMFVRLCDDYGEYVSSFQKSFFRNAIGLIKMSLKIKEIFLFPYILCLLRK